MWRNSYIKPRFAGLDGRVVVILAATLLHVRVWTLEATGVIAISLAMIELWFGITPEVALRKLRSMIAGSRRPATLRDRYRRSIDYGAAEFQIFRRKTGFP
jgi:hypothetical protein